jgi:hypothetical protein
MCLLWKFSMPFFAKPDSSTKRIAKKTDIHHTFEGNNGKILGVSENQADSELVPAANGTGTASIHEERAIPLWTPHVRQLVLNYADTEIHLYASENTLFDINCPYTYPSSTASRRGGKSTSFSDGDDQWRQTCVGSEVYAKDTCPCTDLQLLHHYHGFRQELTAHRRILGICTCPF